MYHKLNVELFQQSFTRFCKYHYRRIEPFEWFFSDLRVNFTHLKYNIYNMELQSPFFPKLFTIDRRVFFLRCLPET